MEIMTNKKTNETKQTAVDKIVSLLNKKGFSPVLTDEEIKSFKEMEEVQIINAYTQGQYDGDNIREGDAYEYYNLIYKDNK
jgi:hypothetical protein